MHKFNYITSGAAGKGLILLAIGLFGAVFALAAAVQAYAQTQDGPPSGSRLITLHEGGIEKSFVTTASTIQAALAEADIELDPRDKVEPALDEELVAETYTVNLYRARPLLVVDGMLRSVTMTASRAPESIAEDAGITLYPEDITSFERPNDILGDGVAEQLVIDRATAFEMTLYGETFTARTQAKTVGEMLEEKSITLDSNDRVSMPKNTPITEGMSLRIWREGKQTITVDEEIDFEVEQIQDANREIGYRQVRTPGVKGERTVTYEIIIQDGQETSRQELVSITKKEPVKQVEVVGTKNNYSDSLNEWLLALRTCEARSNLYQTNTGNGFYGAYQFMPSTWDRTASAIGRDDLVGVLPHLANPADQDMMVIANTNRSSGGLATQHPGCYRSLGLSQFPPSR